MHYKIKRYKLRTRRFFRRLEKRYRDHRFLLPAAVVAATILIAGVITFALRDSAISVRRTGANIVVLHADDETQVLPTREATVGDFLKNAGITLNDGDVVEPSLDEEIFGDDFRVNVYRAAPVTIYDEQTRIVAFSAAKTSRSIVSQAGLEVFPEDIVTTRPSQDFLRDGLGHKVVIERSVPVTLIVYGVPLATRTHADTVRQLLAEKNIELKEGETVQPALDNAVSDSEPIFINRKGIKVETRLEEIAMPVEYIADASLSFGVTAVRQRGSPGQRLVTYQVDTVTGNRSTFQEIVIRQPVKQVVARGQAISISSDKVALMRAAGIRSSDFPYVQYIINHENGLWCPTRWQGQFHCPEFYEEKYPGAESDTSLGYGLCQSTPANKMARMGSDWRISQVTQLRWCTDYAVSRYGGWQGAYEAWTRRAATQGRGWW